MVGDRNDGSQKWKSLESNHPPFNMLYFDKSAYCHNRYFAFARDSRMHPTLNRLTSKICSHHESLHYGKMAAVSVMHMRTGSYAHIIGLINFGIP